jgi:hypothetical protein
VINTRSLLKFKKKEYFTEVDSIHLVVEEEDNNLAVVVEEEE